MMKRREKGSAPKPRARVNARKMAVAAAAHLKLIQLSGLPSCISPLPLLSPMLFSASESWKKDGREEKETVNEGRDAAASERKAYFTTTPLDDDAAAEKFAKKLGRVPLQE